MTAVAKAVGEQVVEVWPENHLAFTIFCDLQTQWSAGMAGATGLRYEAVYPLLDRRARDAEEWEQLFEDIQALESAALKAMGERD